MRPSLRSRAAARPSAEDFTEGFDPAMPPQWSGYREMLDRYLWSKIIGEAQD
jgi:hypothetical protein